MTSQLASMTRCDWLSDRGAATVFGVTIMLGLVSLLMMISAVGSWLLAHAHAMSVADVAALAAVTEGSCTAADHVAQSNGSRLLDCQWDSGDVIVTVSFEVSTTPVQLPVGSVHASARAGF